ncbi:unnamed protein product [Parnassius apollo]|uniref:(apollo) hypothetical protein n=1 Tax=Parnassius apollo TaxID=110799 RepID=A0A8S3XIS7_PARAO|nr:unnamed protein product [Parnassius apollo]
MFSPEEQQIEILLLKTNLEEIENDLVVQRSALPELDAESEEKYQETMTALHVARTLNTEMERLKLENMRLTAKRLQLKNQCEDITKSLEQTRENRIELEKLLKEEERDIELQIRNYEESLREKADRFRKTRNFYNEDEMKKELEMINQMVIKLETEEESQRNFVKELQKRINISSIGPTT